MLNKDWKARNIYYTGMKYYIAFPTYNVMYSSVRDTHVESNTKRKVNTYYYRHCSVHKRTRVEHIPKFYTALHSLGAEKMLVSVLILDKFQLAGVKATKG